MNIKKVILIDENDQSHEYDLKALNIEQGDEQIVITLGNIIAVQEHNFFNEDTIEVENPLPISIDNYTPINPSEFFKLNLSNELQEIENSEQIFPILENTEAKSICVSLYYHDLLLEREFFDLDHLPLTIGPAAKNADFIFEGTEDVITINELTHEVLRFGLFTLEISPSDKPGKLKTIPFWLTEKQSMKQIASMALGLLLPLFLLMLIDTNKPEEKKELAIIYKSPMQAPENNTHKSLNESTEQKLAKKATNEPQKVAKKVAASAATEQVKPKKAYSFDLAANMDASLNNKAQNSLKDLNQRAVASTKESVNLDTQNAASDATASTLESFGSDLQGLNKKSLGAKGLIAKAGGVATFAEEKTVVLGSMDPELLRKILQEYLPQFRYCYQEELNLNSEDIKGIIDLNFQIQSNGKATKIAIATKDTRFSAKGTNCMSKVLSIIDFPKPKGGGVVDVKQPLNFFAHKENG
jgi:hypothetical protein